MAGLIREEKHRIRSYEVDRHHRLTLERLVNFAQDIAMAQGEGLGIGQQHLVEQQLAWVIVRFDIQCHRCPIYNEEIHIKTQPVGFHKLTADRKFWFFDEKGFPLATIASQWVMVDGNKGRIKPIPEFYPRAYGFVGEDNQKLDYEKLTMPDQWNIEWKERVRFSDLDFNNHVNNGRYLRWMMDALPEEILSGHGLSRLQVSFKKEARLDEDIQVRVALEPVEKGSLQTVFELRNHQGVSLVQALGQWDKFSE